MRALQRLLHERSRAHAASLAVVIALAILSCTMQSRNTVAPHQWWRERGPVVPHDTFPADCSLCHTSEGWRTLRADFAYDHATEAGVPLVGAHAKAECLRCHNDRGPVQVFAAKGCAGCHEDVHQGQLGNDCKACHDETNWRPNEQIAAHNRTRFPLVGAHVAAACWRCHPGAQVGNFMRADTSCVACHAQDLARAAIPNHFAQDWVDRCDRCHIPTSWTGGGFNHGTWPLTGQHKSASCTQCHVGNVFAGTPTMCVDCHLADYNGAQMPNHVALNISTNCAQCHSTNGWQGALFDHTGIANNCVQCHLPDYNATTMPNHAALNIRTSCENCHSTNTWLGAQFDHTGVTSNCVQCHLADYNATTSPNHTAAMFPTTCESCHTSTTNWNQATFSHSFPINNGDHDNFSCAQCHTNPSNYQQFTCTQCHSHNQQDMADEHQNVSGYMWVSSACYQCHPDGQE